MKSANRTSLVNVALRCNVAPRNGTVVLNGRINLCSSVEALAVLLSEVTARGAATPATQVIDFDAALAPLALTWSASGGAALVAGPGNASVTCTAPGLFEVTLTTSDGDRTTGTPSETALCTASNSGTGGASAISVTINEGNLGVLGDRPEIYKPAFVAVDFTGWLFRDSDDSRTYVLPAGSIVPPGGCLVCEEAAFGFGLGSNDTARVFRRRQPRN